MGDRQINSVPYPRTDVLTESDLFYDSGLPSISRLRQHLQEEGHVNEQCALRLIKQAREIFSREANIVRIEGPVNIVGDIHGQFYDLLTVFEKGGDPAQIRYLFLGDYVDRGQFACECVFLLFALKIKHPTNVFLLRGNHDARHAAARTTNSFKLECETKYGKRYGSNHLYESCMKTFDALPMCGLVNSNFLCMHGGLSKHIQKLSQIDAYDRFNELPKNGPVCDLVWSDPSRKFNNNQYPEEKFAHNSARGCSYYFSYEACRDFLLNNNLLSIIRAHEVKKNGVEFYRKSSRTQFPVLISVFSAPNYCDVEGNLGAILQVDNDRHITPIQFHAKTHPYMLPNYENAFEFCGPKIFENAARILRAILNLNPSETEMYDAKTSEQISNKRDAINQLGQTYSQISRNKDLSLKLRGFTPSPEYFQEILQRDDADNFFAAAVTLNVENYYEVDRFDQLYEGGPDAYNFA